MPPAVGTPALGASVAPTANPATGSAVRSQMALLWNEFATTDRVGQSPFHRRVALLGDALSQDGLTWARKAYDTWLFGTSRPAAFRFDQRAPAPFLPLPFEVFEGTDVMRRLLEDMRKLVAGFLATLTDGAEPRKKISAVARVIRNQMKPGDKERTLWDWSAEPLNYPDLSIGSVSVSIWRQLSSVQALWDLLHELGPFSDIAATLGSYRLHGYVNGTVRREDQGAVVRIDRYGVRIADSYDFEGEQPLGWWYPERGHVLPGSRSEQPYVNPVALWLKELLWNSHFRAFRDECSGPFNEFLGRAHKGAPQLRCRDYWLVSPMRAVTMDQEMALEWKL